MQTEEYYDVFISFKNSDEYGSDTLDKRIAYELYTYLSKKKLKVFFSSETLAKHGTDKWRVEIENAIGVSKVFIAVGSQKKFMESKWLQWERIFFLGLRSQDNTKVIYNYIITPMSLNDLPDDIKEISTFTPNTLDDLYTYISNHLSKTKQLKPNYQLNTEKALFFQKINLNSFYRILMTFSIIFVILFLIWTFTFPYSTPNDFVSILFIVSFIFTKFF